MLDHPYEAPKVQDLGTLRDLTLEDNKDLTGFDGDIFQNQQLGDVS